MNKIAVFSVGAALMAGVVWGAEVNLVKNGGFEEEQKVNTEQQQPYVELLARFVDIEQGEFVAMPVGWTPNVSDGWLKGQASALRYVRGEPGKDVHGGTRALMISSKNHAAVMDGRVAVESERIPGQPSLKLNGPNRFSIYAKGTGNLMVYAYTYDKRGLNIYGKVKSSPDKFVLTDTWTKCEGTIEFTGPEVGYCILVIAAGNGAATIDDAELFGE